MEQPIRKTRPGLTGAIVDAVVVDPGQQMRYDLPYDPLISGERRGPTPVEPPEPLNIRSLIGRRAYQELTEGDVINFGVGIGEGVAKMMAERGEVGRYYQTIEHGTYGGSLLVGLLFGFVRSAA